MQSFTGKIAVITGGGTGMGRELAIQLSSEGCHVAICDVSQENMQETVALCEAACKEKNLTDIRVTHYLCDVSIEAQIIDFKNAVLKAHDTEHINLLFNNAGIAGGGSFINDTREDWEKTFAVCWFGVYFGSRAFMPLLVASDEGYIINTSSINGFWAAIGPGIAHTSYCAAKFAVKGFTEALITDLRTNAPHVKAAVVMPGHIGTSIIINSGKARGRDSAMDMSAEEVTEARAQMLKQGLPVGNLSDDHIREAMQQRALDFRDKAPTSAKTAVNIILDNVRENKWRILVGDDALLLDERVRATPEIAYEEAFFTSLTQDGLFNAINGEDKPS